MLEVNDAEVGVERWEDPNEVRRREEQAEAERRRAADSSEDDPLSRALNEMMGGALDSNDGSGGDGLPERPAFLDDPSVSPSEYSEEQQKELKEYEVQERQAAEERERRRKVAEGEIRKLRADADTAQERFDEMLEQVLQQRTRIEASLHQIDSRRIGLLRTVDRNHLQSLALQTSVGGGHGTDGEGNAGTRSAGASPGMRAREQSRREAEVRDQARREAEAARERVDAAQIEDRALEKAFRRDLAEAPAPGASQAPGAPIPMVPPLDPDHADLLLKLFRRRVTPKRVGQPPGMEAAAAAAISTGAIRADGRRSSLADVQRKAVGRRGSSFTPAQLEQLEGLMAQMRSGDAAGTPDATGALPEEGPDPATEASRLDPWASAEAKRSKREAETARRARVEPLDPLWDTPEGLEPAWWGRVVEARDRKVASEARVRALQAEAAEAARYLARVTQEEEARQARAEAALSEAERLRQESRREVWDLDVPLLLKQGQVEVTQALTSADMGDARLLPREGVEEENTVIQRHGGQKVDTLSAIKDFKKGIYEEQWENRRLDMLEEDWVEKTKEFQLLRVTKSLQMLIKDGEDASGTSEAVGMENRLEYNRQIFRKKKEEKQLALDRHQQQIAQRKQQNQLFAAEVREMQATGEDQSKMHEAHISDGSESQIAPPGAPGPESSLQKRMRSLVTLRKLIDISKAQAEEVVLLSQELDRLRLRTYPSFPQPMHGMRQRGPDEVNPSR